MTENINQPCVYCALRDMGWFQVVARTTSAGRGRQQNVKVISHVRPDLFDLVVDDIVDAALGLELRHGRVGGGQVEPLRAGLQVGLRAESIAALITVATFR